TATVFSQTPGSNTPQGTVTFSIDGVPQTSVTLVNGMASFTPATLPAGSHVVTATYSGDSNFTTSTGLVNETVSGIRDVSRLVSVTPVPLPLSKRMGKGHTQVRRLRVKNLSGSSITGPVYLVLDRLSRGVMLQNATGFSQMHVTPGDPFV